MALAAMACAAPPQTCESGETLCDDACVILASDPRHCGACGEACAPGEVCDRSRCELVCPGSLSKCDGRCVDAQADRENCGGCGNVCAPGEVCSAGACALSCQSGLTECEGRCTDLARDRDHCGECGTSCAPGEFCVDGDCALVCPSNRTACDGACVDRSSDRANCGECGNRCGPGEICGLGQCVLSCQPGLVACDGKCVDLQSDRRTCGDCDTGCAVGEVCSGGECGVECAAPLVECAGLCVDTARDVRHCGACLEACDPGEVCTGGHCARSCASDELLCAGRCIDPRVDRAHCGACGNGCGAGFVCRDRQCVLSCQDGLSVCGATCVDTGVDPRHCGGCDAPCASGTRCSAGRCVTSCPSGETDCAGSCIDLQTDARRCGTCTTACRTGEACVAGLCDLQCAGGTTECESVRCVNLQLSRADCGACGVSCAPDQLCIAGRCVLPACPGNPTCAPLAEAGSPRVVRPGVVVQLDGRASSDPLGGAIRYTWTQVAGQTVTLAGASGLLASQPTFTAPATPQQLVFQLVVTTESGRTSAADTVSVDVVLPPVARITPANLSILPGESGQLSGATSSDPGGAALSYVWSVASGPVTLGQPSGAMVPLAAGAGASGIAVVRLVVRNAYVESDPVTVQVAVDASAAPPTIDAGADQQVTIGAPVLLGGTASSLFPTETFTWSWRRMSGPGVSINNVTIAAPSFTAPMTEGTIVLELTVTGSRGGQARDTVSITTRDTIPPHVTATTPTAGTLASPFTATVTFDELVSPTTLADTNVFVVDGTGTKVEADIAWDATTRTARLTYWRPLVAGGAYTLRVRGVRDLALVPNTVADLDVAFTARAVAWRLFSDPTNVMSTEPTRPRVVWTPLGTRVTARRRAPGLCAGISDAETLGAFVALDVDEAAQRLSFVATPTCLRATDGGNEDSPSRLLHVGSSTWAISYGGDQPILRRDTGSWTTVVKPSGLSGGGYALATDRRDPIVFNFMGYSSGYRFTGSAWESAGLVNATAQRFEPVGDLFLAASTDFEGRTPTYVPAGSSWISAGTVPGATGLASRVRRILSFGGRPLIVRAEVASSGNSQVRAYLASGTTVPFTYNLIGPPATPTTGARAWVGEAVLIGSTLYVTFIEGESLRLRSADVSESTVTWRDIPSPVSTNLATDASCAVGSHSLDAGPDGIWLAWSENCAGTTNPAWRTYVRKLE